MGHKGKSEFEGEMGGSKTIEQGICEEKRLNNFCCKKKREDY